MLIVLRIGIKTRHVDNIVNIKTLEIGGVFEVKSLRIIGNGYIRDERRKMSQKRRKNKLEVETSYKWFSKK